MWWPSELRIFDVITIVWESDFFFVDLNEKCDLMDCRFIIRLIII